MQTENEPDSVDGFAATQPFPEAVEVPADSIPSPPQTPENDGEPSESWIARHRLIAAISAGVLLLFAAGMGRLLWRSHRAEADAGRARQSPNETPEQLARRYVATGARLLDDGDNFGSLLWFAEALKLDRGTREQEANDRLRIGSVLRQSPKLLQLWFAGGPVNSAEFSSDGHLVLAAVQTNTVCVWNTESGEPQNSLLIHKGDRPIEAHFSPDARMIVSVTGDSACLWSTKTGKLLRSLPHAGAQHAAFSLDGDLLATSGRDGTIKIWSTTNLGNGTRTEALHSLPHKKPVVRLSFVSAAKGLLTLEEGGSAHFWESNSDDGTWAETVPAWRPEEGERYAAFDLQGHVLIVLPDGKARVWDVGNGTALPPLLREFKGLTHAALSSDERWLATTDAAGITKIWNMETGAREAQLSGHKAAATLWSFSPSGQKIVSGIDGAARVFESATGTALTPPLRHNGQVTAAQFHPDGQRLLTASSDGTLRLWSLWPERRLLPFSEDFGLRVGSAMYRIRSKWKTSFQQRCRSWGVSTF